MESRDDGARRELADQVKTVAAEGADRFGEVVADQVAAMYRAVSDGHDPASARDRGAIDRAFDDVTTAASAVVLASDLRAPAEDGQVFEYDKYGNSRPVNESPFRVPSGGVSPNRQGWRARLANVERWLADVAESIAISTNGEESVPDWSRLRTGVDVALAEVRAMIDGAD